MRYQFETLLQKHSLKEQDLSAPTKAKVIRFRKVLAGMEEAETQLKDNNLTVKKKAELTKQIEDAKEFVTTTDTELTDSITKWIPNREKYAESTKRLAQSRAQKSGQPAGQPVSPAPAQTATSTTPTGTLSHTTSPTKKDKQTQAVQTTDEKKGWGGWGWVVGGILAFGLAAVGFQIYRAYGARNNP